MGKDRFLIAPYDKESGLETDLRPWLIPDTAFARLNNAYVFRGRVRKRFGSRWFGNQPNLSRFKVNVGTIAGNPTTGYTPKDSGGNLIVPPAIGQGFSIGNVFFTVNALGSPIQLLRTDAAPSANATFDTGTGQWSFSGFTVGTTIYYYPALPVMGLLDYENNAINDEPIIGFDTSFAYSYGATGWERITGEVTPDASFWTGSDSQFFWGTTWTGANGFEKIFFVTNFNEQEANHMRFYDGTNWDNFRPPITGAAYLNMAEILVVFHNRLVAFNTWEGAGAVGDNYQNRARWCQVGTPLYTVDANAWRQDIPGRGSALDCPTTEAIVTVEFIKDRLIVFFERSTWEFVYTGNQIYPFAWQQINTELGAESTFSIVPFDKIAIGVGNVGIHACNGANVERIDAKIPDEVFAIHNVDAGVERVYGIRDYFVEMIYWTFPADSANGNFPFPNKVLVYNYKTNTWSFNDDSITVFGYYQAPIAAETPQITWDSTTVTWDDEVSWGSGPAQLKFRQVVGGNQEGFTFIIDSEEPTNASVIQITDFNPTTNTVTAINHNMRVGEYIYFERMAGTGTITNLNGTIAAIITVVDRDSFIIQPDTSVTGTYRGGGLFSRVSNIQLLTKEYNFYAKQARNASINKIDFMVDSTGGGQITVNYFTSTNPTPLVIDGINSNTILGQNGLQSVLETTPYATVPFEQLASRLIHSIYTVADGEWIQLYLAMSDAQMRNVDVRRSPFQLHFMLFYAQPTAYRFS